MNRVWAIRAQAQISELQAKCKSLEGQLAQAVERIKALEDKKGPGRPPKEKTE